MQPPGHSLRIGLLASKLTPDELRKLIQKLRWVGLDEEADRLCAKLARESVGAEIVVEPAETD